MGAQEQERAQLQKLTGSSPTGTTPICASIKQVVASVRAQAPELRAKGQRALVEIATDGVSTDGDLASALRPLEQLPVMVVVRLCTDDRSVVSYWNEIDDNLELEMDVLDDLEGEAAEVHALNPWLTYGEGLHHVREWGSANKLLDLLDETRFTEPQVASMVELILGQGAVDFPPPTLDLDGFVTAVERAQHAAGAGPANVVFDPLCRRRAYWLKTRAIRTAFADGMFTCMQKAWRQKITGSRNVRVRDWLFSSSSLGRSAASA